MTGKSYFREISLAAGERIDDLQRNGLGIIQKKDAFCFGMDAVLLSGFARVKKGERVVDLGTGTGIIPLLLHAKTGAAHLYGLEVQPQAAEAAAASVYLNGLERDIDILCGDLCEIKRGSGGKEMPVAAPAGFRFAETESKEEKSDIRMTLPKGAFQVVTANPPYMKAAHGLQNPDDAKAIARHECRCTLSDVCEAAAALLADGGRFYLVHRPLRMTEITEELLRVRLEPKRMKFVHPDAEKEAAMVLIEAVKGGKKECRVEKPLIVYQSPGVYTDEIYRIYGY